MSSLSWDLQPRYIWPFKEELVELAEFIDAVLADLTDEGKVLNLLLYLWLESGVEFLESVEVVLLDSV